MPTLTPTPGSYLVLRLDPVATARGIDDPILQSAARRLAPRTYVGYIDRVDEIPWPDKPTHRCHIRFVGQGLPAPPRARFTHSAMSVPILPETAHPLARTPLCPSRPFPFASCYQYNYIDRVVRIPTQEFREELAVTLSLEEVRRHDKYELEDYRKWRTLWEAGYGTPSDETSSWEDLGSPLANSMGSFHDSAVDHTSIVEPDPWPDELRLANNGSTYSLEYQSTWVSAVPISLADFEDDVLPFESPYNVLSPYGFHFPTHTFASVRPPSLRSDYLNLVMPTFDQSNADDDMIPIVYASLDLSEISEIADPHYYMDEEAEIRRLMAEARARAAASASVGSKTSGDTSDTGQPNRRTRAFSSISMPYKKFRTAPDSNEPGIRARALSSITIASRKSRNPPNSGERARARPPVSMAFNKCPSVPELPSGGSSAHERARSPTGVPSGKPRNPPYPEEPSSRAKARSTVSVVSKKSRHAPAPEMPSRSDHALAPLEEALSGDASFPLSPKRSKPRMLTAVKDECKGIGKQFLRMARRHLFSGRPDTS